MSVPRKANDAMHLSMLDGLEAGGLTFKQLGEVILQDAFQVFDSKSLLPSRKGRERRVFLFELFILFAKETKPDSSASSKQLHHHQQQEDAFSHQNSQSSSSYHHQSKYVYKNKVNTSDLGITEHVEGDNLKFAIWTNNHHNKIVLKSHSLETKLVWIKKLREIIQENTYFTSRLSTLNLSAKQQQQNKIKDSQQPASLLLNTTNNAADSSQQQQQTLACSSSNRLINSGANSSSTADRNSIASYSSSNTTDSGEKFRT